MHVFVQLSAEAEAYLAFSQGARSNPEHNTWKKNMHVSGEVTSASPVCSEGNTTELFINLQQNE